MVFFEKASFERRSFNNYVSVDEFDTTDFNIDVDNFAGAFTQDFNDDEA